MKKIVKYLLILLQTPARLIGEAICPSTKGQLLHQLLLLQAIKPISYAFIPVAKLIHQVNNADNLPRLDKSEHLKLGRLNALTASLFLASLILEETHPS